MRSFRPGGLMETILRVALRAAMGVAIAVVLWAPGAAWADAKLCSEFRNNIIRMENESVRPPGWFNLDTYLRLLYKADCVDHPTAAPELEYWYDIHGNSTGVVAGSGVPRPKDGAYTTTEEIGTECAGEDPGNPSMCALLKGVEKACANARDDRQARLCRGMGMDTSMRTPPPKGDELPPMKVALDGGPFELDPACMGALSSFGNDLALDDSRAADRPGWLDTMRNHCPDFLAALERRTGANAAQDPAKFWPAFGQLLLSGFAPPGSAQKPIGSVTSDPGFREMCRQAKNNMDTCEQRQNNMRSIGTDDVGTASQAGAFNSCRILYGQVYAMCNSSDLAAQRLASRLPKPPPPARPVQQATAPAANPGQSRSPPSGAPGMTPQCQALVRNYVAAAQANDGAKSVADYNALKRAGGCNVLDKVDRTPAPAPAGPDPRFVSRGATPLLNQTVTPCDQSPDQCAADLAQLKAGTSPEAVAAMVGNAIGIGLQLGTMMGNAMLSGMPSPAVGAGRTSDMSSIGNRPVRSTYGQGSPYRPAPPSSPSTITGTIGSH
jgi:hypothetical protein